MCERPSIRTIHRAGMAALALLLSLAPSEAASAQQESSSDLPLFEGDQATLTTGGREFRFTFGGGYTSTFNTDIDSGGDFSVDRLSAGLNVATDLGRDATIDFRLNAGMASYSFGGDDGFGGLDPWNDVQSIAFGAAVNWNIDDDWSVFGGPIFTFARESGADWGDAFNFGGIAGVTYKFSNDLVIGGGLGILTQIEESVRFFPIIILQWNFAPQWSLSNAGPSGGRTSIELTGLELVWKPRTEWEFALGAGASYSRFRLDDEDIAPDGVGQDESTPVWLRASWKPKPTISIDAIGGMAFGGELKLDDEDGDGIARSDYDSPLFLGIFGSIRF